MGVGSCHLAVGIHVYSAVSHLSGFLFCFLLSHSLNFDFASSSFLLKCSFKKNPLFHLYDLFTSSHVILQLEV